MDELTLDINEIFYSLQGEGTRAGIPCIFIRLAGCNLRCVWCDTKYALTNQNSTKMTLKQILNEIHKYNCNFVEITGGEPLLQDNSILLMNELLIEKMVAIETNGSILMNNLYSKIIKIMDVKCPDSKMEQHNLFANFQFLTPKDDIKFVVASEQDFEWSCNIIEKYKLANITPNLIFSAVTDSLSHQRLAELILENNYPSKNCFRMQIQIHKAIWGNEYGK